MQRRLIALLLAAALLPAPNGVEARAGAATAQQQDFGEELQRWRQIADPEQKIALGEQLLADATAGGEASPVRADIEFELGIAYFARPRGERADNIERSIKHLEAATTVWSKQSMPVDWARAHNNLGIAYINRIRGDTVGNIELALAHLEAAEPILTREAQPQAWGELQNNFAVVYLRRLQGDRAANLEAAIRHFEAGLTVIGKDTDPYRWGMIQNNLAAAYADRVTGTRAENQKRAMDHIEAALSVFTRETFPNEWAQLQHNLGIAYFQRVEGDRSDNQEQALAHFQEALSVFGRESAPEQWAQIQFNVGITYAERLQDARAENRRKAVTAFEAALTVFTRDAFPQNHFRTMRRLAPVLLEAGELEKASLTQEDARQAFLLLLGQGLDEAEARSLIAEAGPLFAEAAFTAAQRGDGDRAMLLANEGRGRLLTIALRQQSLRIGEADRRRLDELRAGIRTAQQTAGTAHAGERAAALMQVATLRKEVLALVQSAEEQDQSAFNEARALSAKGNVVVIPVHTGSGGKLLVLAKDGTVSRTSIVDLPALTTARLAELLVGAEPGRLSGWLGSYFVNYLGDRAEAQKKWPEWVAAIDGLGGELWQLVGAPLTSELKRRGVASGARLVWLPSGWLGTLPIGLAQNPSSQRRLIDDYEIVYAPNLEALAASEDVIAGTNSYTLAAVVNPTGDLPGTEKEGAIVVSHFKPEARTLVEGKDATPDNVLAALKGRTHWHFASHGAFAWQDARQSGLVLHGPTRLTVGELLEADGLGHPRLVVLSACETGLYDISKSPDEFIGLPGTFTALGAAGVLGTLWPVSDAATALLIGKFYELHIDAGASPPAALRGAQLWLRDATAAELDGFAKLASASGRLQSRHLAEIETALSGKGEQRARALAGPEVTGSTAAPGALRPYAHPYYWAGFIFTGL